ncbi:MAG: hypothetical protein ACM36C_13295, partial [Acidobacteriota bacterium]
MRIPRQLPPSRDAGAVIAGLARLLLLAIHVSRRINLIKLVVVVALAIIPTHGALAYSVLAHESLIDAAWVHEIAPLIRRRFPAASPAHIERARAFAYGGS